MVEEKKEGKRIPHRRNGKERQLPELPDISVDGLCEETRTLYEFNGCYWHGHTSMPFRHTLTACADDTLAERYGNTISRLERISQARYHIKVQWECEFELPEDVKVEQHVRLRLRGALYGGRTEVMQEGEETIKNVDVMSLYPWVCKYFKFRDGHPTIHLDCRDIPAMRKRRTHTVHRAPSEGLISSITALQM